ncbi:hypothetical protein EVAR_96203_1 [Eumeta japonica]|uniref:Uncharacterized protein n=1 Tax=Eumeta variegata TaxID=151549 RepID=A0A4C1VJ91_EUMVA|nr:hypothetical protein EVAR_96203_1 [Eumeta japonica]
MTNIKLHTTFGYIENGLNDILFLNIDKFILELLKKSTLIFKISTQHYINSLIDGCNKTFGQRSEPRAVRAGRAPHKARRPRSLRHKDSAVGDLAVTRMPAVLSRVRRHLYFMGWRATPRLSRRIEFAERKRSNVDSRAPDAPISS